MIEQILQGILTLWGLYVACILFVFVLGQFLAPIRKAPTCTGFRVIMPEHLRETLTPDEYQAVLMHERGHMVECHIWINLLRIVFLRPMNAEQRLVQELEADNYSAIKTGKPKALASALRKLSSHPIDMVRANRLDTVVFEHINREKHHTAGTAETQITWEG